MRTSASSSSSSDDDLVGVDVVADRQLPRRDDALGLVADVEQHLVAVDLDDRAGDDVAVVELDDRGVDRVGERLAAEVVEDDGRVLVDAVVGVVVVGRRHRGASVSGASATAVATPVAGSGAEAGASACVRLGDGGVVGRARRVLSRTTGAP